MTFSQIVTNAALLATTTPTAPTTTATYFSSNARSAKPNTTTAVAQPAKQSSNSQSKNNANSEETNQNRQPRSLQISPPTKTHSLKHIHPATKKATPPGWLFNKSQQHSQSSKNKSLLQFRTRQTSINITIF